MARYEEIRIRRDSTLNWYAANPRLGLGELGIDMDLHRVKAGNGIDRWNQLPYLNDDAYTLITRLEERLTDTEQSIRDDITTKKLDSDQQIGDLRRDVRAVKAEQGEYESRLTSRQAEYEATLSDRQTEHEREVTQEVSGMRKELNDGLADFERTGANLTLRLDTIVGSVTEDTEILDARVDAENEVHPNLGHNIRNIHEQLNRERELRIERDEDLQEQTDKNAYASLRILNILDQKADKKGTDIISLNEDVLTAVNTSSRYGIADGTGNQRKQFTMLCMTDTHHQSARLEAGIRYLNAIEAIDCGCCLGDICNSYNNSVDWYIQGVQKSRKPFYTVIGNHEMGSGGNRIKGATTANVFRKYMKPTAEVIGLPELNNPYYRVDWDNYGISLIVLDGYILPEETNSAGEFIYKSPHVYFGQAQIDWLIKELSDIPAGNALVVMLHMRDFQVRVCESNFSQKPYQRELGTETPYGKNGIIQDIIEAWRLGGEYEDEYIPNDATGTAETIRVKCDYRARGTGDFACWLTGHYHQDYICRSVKYPSQLAIHLAATTVGWRAQGSDLGYTPGTKSEDVVTVLTVDKISRTVKLVRIGSNITHDMRDRTMTSISWDYDPTEEPQKALELLSNGLTSQAVLRQEAYEHLQEQTDTLSGALLRVITGTYKKEQEVNEWVKSIEALNPYFQWQVDKLLNAILENAVNLHDEVIRRKASESEERQSRFNEDRGLQTQLDTAVQGILWNTLILSETLARQREALADEAQQRRKVREALDAEISERTGHDTQQDAGISRNAQDIESEAQARVDGDLGLSRQADSNAEGNIHNALNLSESNERHRAALAREEQSRVSRDKELQEQIDRNAEAGIDNALNLHQEAEQRRKSDERIKALKDESARQNEVDDFHQQQIEAAILSILQNILTLSETLSRQREALKQEVITRMEQDAGILSQVKLLALADVQQMLNIAAMNTERRQEEVQERLIRVEQDDGLQEQMNQLAFANMWLTVNEHETRRKMREIEITAESIPGRAATDEEFDEMLDELYNKP